MILYPRESLLTLWSSDSRMIRYWRNRNQNQNSAKAEKANNLKYKVSILELILGVQAWELVVKM